jgi:hypothetical protein
MPLIRAVIWLSPAGIHLCSALHYASSISAASWMSLKPGVHIYSEGITMKRIARTLVIVTLASTGTAAVAADTPYPSSVQQEIPLSSEFPNSPTYKQEHRKDAGSQSKGQQSGTPTYPSAGAQQTPLSSEFPNTQTYKDEHKNAPVTRSTTPTFPYSVPAESSMADEGLVPGISGVPPADGARGGTR